MKLSVLFLLSAAIAGSGCSNQTHQPVPVKTEHQERCTSTPAPPPAHSQTEISFARRLGEFLDFCNGTARLMKTSPGELIRRSNKMSDLYAAIPEPPVAWATEALANADKLRASLCASEMLEQADEEWIAAIGDGSGPLFDKQCHEIEARRAAVICQTRDRVSAIRRLVPAGL